MRWRVYSSEHSGHAPLFLALITTLKVITGLQEGTLLLWTATLTPGVSTFYVKKAPCCRITQVGLCLVAHVDAQSLLVSNTLSQGVAAALSSVSFLFLAL